MMDEEDRGKFEVRRVKRERQKVMTAVQEVSDLSSEERSGGWNGG